MLPFSLVLVVLGIIFFTSLLRAMVGFGNALTAMPLLAMSVGMSIATPLVGFTSVVLAIVLLWRNWSHVDIRIAGKLFIASCVGVPVGLIFLNIAPEQLVKGMLGILLIAFGSYNLLALKLPQLKWGGYAYLFGFIAGMFGAAYNTNGPFAIIYGTLARWSPERFRATLQGYFLPTSFVIFVSQGIAGLWTPEVVRLSGYSIPVVLVAIALGERLHHAIPRHLFERMVHLLLVVMGGMLLLTG